MLRIVLPAFCAVTLAACGTAAPLSTGLAPGAGSIATAPSYRGSATKPRATTARATDRATDRTGDRRAPAGALADRDYAQVTLNPELARELINTYRKSHGLAGLRLSAELTEAAKIHSRDLASGDRISHYGSDGSNPFDRVRRVGYQPKLAAENVGTGQASIEEVVEGWKKSDSHNKNLLLGDATDMGIALVRAPTTEFKTFWTLVVATPL